MRFAGTSRSLQSGAFQRTDQPLDVAIQGNGFFAVETNTGTRAYTRAGSFLTDANGFLRTTAGAYVLSGNARVQTPANSANLRIENDGRILSSDSNGETTDLGTVQVDSFANPQGLESIGENAYRPTSSSGNPTPVNLGVGNGLASGFLETDNVDLVAETVGSMLALRAFEANAKTIQTTDEMLKTLVNSK